MNSSPWQLGARLPASTFSAIRRRTIFDHCKWDPQVGDVPILADVAVLMGRSAWSEVAALAERLARELAAAEEELWHRPELHARLGLPWSVRRALARAPRHGVPPVAARVVRFDFHRTATGWRISEANCDVPGGFIEASGFTHLIAPHYPGAEPTGDPTESLAGALARVTPVGGLVALVHATAYTDDVQVMAYLGKHLERRGLRVALLAPDNIVWRDGTALVRAGPECAPADVLVRFFPAEWMANLPRDTRWSHFFAGSRTPQCNPTTALLTQTKRFPLVWDRLDTKLDTWRALLPETRDPRDADWRGDPGWILKPAMGRVGEGIGMPGVTVEKEWRQIARSARFHPSAWVAQRRFDEIPVSTQDGPVHICLGVYTVDARAAGAYGRLARRPLTDGSAPDAAILVVNDQEGA